jgi:hypothetical protein
VRVSSQDSPLRVLRIPPSTCSQKDWADSPTRAGRLTPQNHMITCLCGLQRSWDAFLGPASRIAQRCVLPGCDKLQRLRGDCLVPRLVNSHQGHCSGCCATYTDHGLSPLCKQMQNLRAVCPCPVRAGRIAAHVMDVMEGIVMEYGDVRGNGFHKASCLDGVLVCNLRCKDTWMMQDGRTAGSICVVRSFVI